MTGSEPASFVSNPPPGWPVPGEGWTPPAGWKPDPSWPPAPAGWVFWAPATAAPPSPPPPAPVAAPAGAVLLPAPVPPVGALSPPSTDAVLDEPSRVSEGTPARQADLAPERVAQLEAEIAALRAQLAAAASASEVVELNDERALQEVGIYRYHHPVENSEEYRERLGALQEKLKAFVLAGNAILASDMFTFNGSLAKGRKMTADFSKLMLRAYNAEADNCVRTVRAGNVLTATKRLDAAVVSIQRLGSMMEMRINPDYHLLRIEEIQLTADYQMKVQQEREEAREERERLREERKAEAELAAERERLEKERSHYANALASIATTGDAAEVAALQTKLAELETAIEQNDYRAANIRAGYVYVISNPGSLGPNVVKIGMTRRLEPLDRVRELGDASVPFPYSVHALFFSDDAVTLENELHSAFGQRKVNRANERREFFFATPHEVREVLASKGGNLLEFTEEPDAVEFFQSRKYWPAKAHPGPV